MNKVKLIKNIELFIMIVLLLNLIGCVGLTQVNLSGINPDSVKSANKTHIVVLGFIGLPSFPTVDETARKGNIRKIASVENQTNTWLYPLVVTRTTIVTGN